MNTTPASDARDQILHAFRAHLRAMTDGDTDALDDLLADGCTLTHITGYVQPKQEWLAQMRAGQFDYHDIVEKDLNIEVRGDTAHLVGRLVTDATVYGTRGDWPLQLSMDYAHVNGAWIVLGSAATTW